MALFLLQSLREIAVSLSKWLHAFAKRSEVSRAMIVGRVGCAHLRCQLAAHMLTQKVYVSHYSGELFASFCRTLFHMLDEETVVWVAGFATCPQQALSKQQEMFP